MATTFEKELRKLFDHDRLFTDTKFVGRQCYGNAEFCKNEFADQYAAHKISLINQRNGVIDSNLLIFGDILGVKKVNDPNMKDGMIPFLWMNNGKLDWYCYHPSQEDYKKLINEVESYLSVFREPERTQDEASGPTMGLY